MPIVLITGLADLGVMRRAGEQGLPLVPKPFRSDTLRAAVAEALRASPSFPALSRVSGHSGE
jgi:FixJ family two-component response regulator